MTVAVLVYINVSQSHNARDKWSKDVIGQSSKFLFTESSRSRSEHWSCSFVKKKKNQKEQCNKEAPTSDAGQQIWTVYQDACNGEE